jgi:hypothetical protein
MEAKKRQEKLERFINDFEERKIGFIHNLVDLFVSPKFYLSLIMPILLTFILTIVTIKFAIVIVSIALGLSLHPLLKTIAESFNLIKE